MSHAKYIFFNLVCLHIQVFPLESGDLMVYVSEDVLDYFNCYITDDVGNVHYRTYRVITMNQPGEAYYEK